MQRRSQPCASLCSLGGERLFLMPGSPLPSLREGLPAKQSTTPYALPGLSRRRNNPMFAYFHYITVFHHGMPSLCDGSIPRLSPDSFLRGTHCGSSRGSLPTTQLRSGLLQARSAEVAPQYPHAPTRTHWTLLCGIPHRMHLLGDALQVLPLQARRPPGSLCDHGSDHSRCCSEMATSKVRPSDREGPHSHPQPEVPAGHP